MPGRIFLRHSLFAGLLLALAACGGGQDGPSDPVRSVRPAQMQPLLAAGRGDGPGLAAALVSSEATVLAVDGRGSVESPAPLRTDQWFHLGSNGKSLTAMAVAAQVEAGRLNWTDTLGQLFPELAGNMRPEYRQRTVREVLGFRAGLPRLELFAEFNDADVGAGSLPEQRHDFARWLLAQPPINTPGTATAYSNASYVLAGAIVERVAGVPFEQALQATVLAPLGLRAAFGLPQSVSDDQPAAHLQVGPGEFVPIAPDDPLVQAVPAWASPAGLFCMPLADYARYAQVHLQALQGRPRLLGAASYQVLHTAQGREEGDPAGLAPGWLVLERADGTRSLEFYGSVDVMNAHIKLLPDRDVGVIVLNNFDAAGQLDQVLGETGEALLGLVRPGAIHVGL